MACFQDALVRRSHGANASLLAIFYRRKSMGLPEGFSARLAAAEGYMEQAAGYLARADRMLIESRWRPLDLADAVAKAVHAAQDPLHAALRDVPLQHLLRGNHLCWHLLDKIALATVVTVHVAPSPALGLMLEPLQSRMHMSLIPDRDTVSDHVRSHGQFHCHKAFRTQIAELIAEQTEAEIAIVDVGGYLGDCILWAWAWLGPRLRALLVEPVEAATVELARSLELNGISGDQISIRSVGVADGVQGFRARPAAFSTPFFKTRSCTIGADELPCQPMPRLDDELAAWRAEAPVSLVHVARGPPLHPVVEGLKASLAAARIERLVVHHGDRCDGPNGVAVAAQLARLAGVRYEVSCVPRHTYTTARLLKSPVIALNKDILADGSV